ncbi:hypothetical protein IGI04_030178 [Brassica rapa subsp. trilocularis]|uniref:BAH domain-containing protein n=1 Tax=Brassica rapa subsp. trilocularis TaxID=1813537 RepID=A0ABQ7LPY2_BRACM|nr:hypothetical protein IGI04_030178 [Brassica rapa subsp. trilocularis]
MACNFQINDEPKKNHLHAVSRLKAVNEEEDQGKKSRKKLGCWLYVNHGKVNLGDDEHKSILCVDGYYFEAMRRMDQPAYINRC